MTLPIDETASRIIAIAKEAVAGIKPSDGVTYFYHEQEAFPYFTLRLSGFDSAGYGERVETEEMDTDIFTFTLRFVIGHITQGYVGENDDLLYDVIPAVKSYFNQRNLLQSASYPTACRYLIEARCNSNIGYRVFQNSGTPVLQVGTEFTIRCEFNENIEQAYL